MSCYCCGALQATVDAGSLCIVCRSSEDASMKLRKTGRVLMIVGAGFGECRVYPRIRALSVRRGRLARQIVRSKAQPGE